MKVYIYKHEYLDYIKNISIIEYEVSNKNFPSIKITVKMLK